MANIKQRKYAEGGEKFIPGLGEHFVIGFSGVGISVIDETVALDTEATATELVLLTPNTNAGVNASGVIVHSLGVKPSAVLFNPIYTSQFIVQYTIVTDADASAIYVLAKSFLRGSVGALGVRTRITAIR